MKEKNLLNSGLNGYKTYFLKNLVKQINSLGKERKKAKIANTIYERRQKIMNTSLKVLRV